MFLSMVIKSYERVAFALLATASGCVYRGDLHESIPTPLGVYRWTVTNEATGELLSSGCSTRIGDNPIGSARLIRFRAPVGQRVVATLLEEMVTKQHIQPGTSNDDALWCGTQDDKSRSPAYITDNLDCWKPAADVPVKVLSQQVIGLGSGTDAGLPSPEFVGGQGRQMTLEVTGAGVFRWLPTPLCKRFEHSELEILP